MIKLGDLIIENNINELTYGEAVELDKLEKVIKIHIEDKYPSLYYGKDNILGSFGKSLPQSSYKKLIKLAKDNKDIVLARAIDVHHKKRAQLGEGKSTIKEIIKEILTEGVDDPGILKCVFMAGGPGSGKSFTAKEIFGVGTSALSSVSAGGLKLVNSDTAFEKGLKDSGVDMKELGNIEKDNPELWDMIAGDDNPESIRAQAKNLTKKAQSFYEQGRLGMIIDGTGDEVSKLKKKMQHAQSLGYDCSMVFVNTSLEVALERNRNRDRVLSDELVTGIWKACQNNLGAFQTMFSGNFTVVDNTVYKPVNKAVQKSVDAFMRKPLQNPIGKQWVKTARLLKNANLIKK